jgi:hypothetical protein
MQKTVRGSGDSYRRSYENAVTTVGVCTETNMGDAVSTVGVCTETCMGDCCQDSRCLNRDLTHGPPKEKSAIETLV